MERLERKHIARINQANGHEANEYHDRKYHESQAKAYTKGDPKGLMAYVGKAHAKKLAEYHLRLAKAFEKEESR
jgi:hypothetical protein